MTLAKCTRCGGSATGGTFDDARLQIDHAPGMSRGIPCGDNYNCVEEIVDTNVPEKIAETTIDKPVTLTNKTIDDPVSAQDVSTKNYVDTNTKPSAKKKFKFK